MSKKSLSIRNDKRAALIAKYQEKKKQLKLALKNASTFQEKIHINNKIDKIPRNASSKRWISRCILTGKAKGVYRRFGLCRNKLREFIMWGLIPGFKNSSW